LEEEAFSLKTGEISKVVQVGQYYIILYCQGMTQPAVTEFAAVKDFLHQDILEKKTRLAMEDEYTSVRSDAQIDTFPAAKEAEAKNRQR
jgi:parvulin-like peptidyl-prolyl isomerase